MPQSRVLPPVPPASCPCPYPAPAHPYAAPASLMPLPPHPPAPPASPCPCPPSIMTLQGTTVAINTKGGITVDGAKLVTPDIACSNGIIHVISAVLIPKPPVVVCTRGPGVQGGGEELGAEVIHHH